MSKERELLKEACDLLDDYWKGGKTSNRNRKLFYEIKELLAQPEQTEQEPVTDKSTETAMAIMPNGGSVSNVYAAYEEGRKSAMAGQESLTNEQKSAEAALEQALRDSIDTEKLMQILKDGGILIEVGEQK